MNEDSLKKFNRIISTLTLLQSRKIIKAQDLANRFEVSLRTVYRDIRSLEKAGIPIISEAGIGYSIMEGYRLPPVMFSREEALSFITAEKLMEKLTDHGIRSYYESAMIKIKSVLRSTEKELLDLVDNKIDIRSVYRPSEGQIVSSLNIILESIINKKQIILEYKSVSNEKTYRAIEPVGIFYQNNFWYILGYCLLREDYRQFRTDRIINIQKTETTFTEIHGELSDYKLEYNKAPKTKVRILVDKMVVRYLINSKMAFGFISEKETEKGIEMTFKTAEIDEGFPRWYLTFADCASILEPEELKLNVSKILERIQEKIKEEKTKEEY